MSQSRRKNLISAVTTAESDKAFKTKEHRRERAAARAALADDREPPSAKQFGDPWRGEKDGKAYRPGDAEALRK